MRATVASAEVDVASAQVFDMVEMRGKSQSLREGEAHGRLACRKSRVLKFFFYTPVRCGRGR